MITDEQVDRIIHWALQRGILDTPKPQALIAQATKTVEEAWEVRNACEAGDLNEIIDGIGDVFVTLVILSEIVGVDIEDCIDAAWEEIKDRTGKMVDGVFVKEEELADAE